VRIGPTAWPFTGFIHTYIHTDRQLDKYILDENKSGRKKLHSTYPRKVWLVQVLLVWPGTYLLDWAP
jgi:hypothetical protein